MPRKFPKPFYRSARSCWFVQIGKEQIKLHPNEQEALRLYHELMTSRSKPTAGSTAHASSSDLSLAELFDKFLDWCQKHREPRTYEWYRDHLQSFLNQAKDWAAEPATALKPFAVVEWADAQVGWSPAYRRGGIVAVQRPFNWAVKLGYLAATPIAHIEKPRPQRREQAVTPDDWKRIKERYPEGDRFVSRSFIEPQ